MQASPTITQGPATVTLTAMARSNLAPFRAYVTRESRFRQLGTTGGMDDVATSDSPNSHKALIVTEQAPALPQARMCPDAYVSRTGAGKPESV
jgi:hypothetical protein